jgi:hypothetical protein
VLRHTFWLPVPHLIQFVIGFALLLHVAFWGAGLAMLAVPRAWRRFWPVLIVPAGWVLQSAVVWVAAYAGARGTNSYAWLAEAVPAALLGFGIWRRGARGVMIDLSRFGLVWMLVAGCLLLLITPAAIASRGLTTFSLGSCDAADYAAGARVFMEFARSDRQGFLGLTEVVGIGSTDNFFDFWLRLNHFSPSALIALNGSILNCAPHEITGLITMVFLAGSLPLVFWMARAVMGYSGGASLIVALIFGLSPIGWYAVAHVAMSQLLGAQAIALITWPGIALWRGRLSAVRRWQWSGVLGVGYALLLGSYNFMLLVCFVPSIAYAGGLTLWRGEWGRLIRWALAMLLPLLVCALFFWDRVAVLPERFGLFREYNFGWPIPPLSPEGWLGMVSGPALEPWRFLGLRWILALCVSVPFAWALERSVRRRHPGAWLVIALTVPVLIGYAYLERRAVALGTNASYDAYKLFMVFYPLLLPAFCWWLTLRRSRRLSEWFAVVALAGVVIAVNAIATGMFIWRMAQPPLIVDGELRQLRKIEAMPDVKSVNMLVPDMWQRLWANAFLLRKPQYFQTHTYEGRLNTPLRGEWDLQGGRIIAVPPGADYRPVTPRYSLANTHSRGFIRAAGGAGWHPEETDSRAGVSWQWTKNRATVDVENPQDRPLTVRCTIDGWSFGGGTWRISTAAGEGAMPRTAGAQAIGSQRVRTEFPPITIPPGHSSLVLFSSDRSAAAAGTDSRELGVCVFRWEIAVVE